MLMTTAEKIATAKSTTYFTLFKEGIFYKCYNEDAMLFVTRVKQYKVSATFVKNVGEEMYSIGFPVGEVEKANLTLEDIRVKIDAKNFEICGKDIVFVLNDNGLKNNYKAWIDDIQKQILINGVHESSLVFKPLLNINTIIAMIKKYDLANTTPIQSISFIQQLKDKLQQLEHNNGNL